ncbi:MAG TPA: hypothetical protein VJN93_06290 [Candidatus Acidoferrum sp.]|nr:hypothetical protein [Candidatus Acidoferrum sp.]
MSLLRCMDRRILRAASNLGDPGSPHAAAIELVRNFSVTKLIFKAINRRPSATLLLLRYFAHQTTDKACKQDIADNPHALRRPPCWVIYLEKFTNPRKIKTKATL